MDEPIVQDAELYHSTVYCNRLGVTTNNAVAMDPIDRFEKLRAGLTPSGPPVTVF